jgi:hypothetical protein
MCVMYICALYFITLSNILLFSELFECAELSAPCNSNGESCTDTDAGGHDCACNYGYIGLECETCKL